MTLKKKELNLHSKLQHTINALLLPFVIYTPSFNYVFGKNVIISHHFPYYENEDRRVWCSNYMVNVVHGLYA